MKSLKDCDFSIKTVFDIPIAAITMDETVELILKAISSKASLQHVVVNAGKIVAMQKDCELKNSILSADLINADGQAVVWASHFLGKPLPERVAGIDLMYNLIEMAHREKMKCYFLGAREEVVSKVVNYYSSLYSPDIIAGYHNGYFKAEEEKIIAQHIANSGAQLLFVAFSSPKKEIFINKYKNILNVPFVMGVGGSFDVVAGINKRAPKWMQKLGLEWFYRLVQEPKRMWKRYLIGNTMFILIMLKEKFRQIKK